MGTDKSLGTYDHVQRQLLLRELAERLLAADEVDPRDTGAVYRVHSPSHAHIVSHAVSLAEARDLLARYEASYGPDGVEVGLQRLVWVDIERGQV